MSEFKTVWVHAWHQPASHAGFDWYAKRDDAQRAYEAAAVHVGETHYLFPYETEANESAEATTAAIDGELDEASEHAAIRKTRPL